jgi:hypothetical protein
VERHFNDAVLLQTCLKHGVEILATDDARLGVACQAMGLTVENPIDPSVRRDIASWEKQHLVTKGLPRVLTRIHRWLDPRNAALAVEFRAATQELSRLP